MMLTSRPPCSTLLMPDLHVPRGKGIFMKRLSPLAVAIVLAACVSTGTNYDVAAAVDHLAGA